MLNLRGVLIASTLVIAAFLPGCGGDSDSGSPVITGTLTQAISSRNETSSTSTTAPIANARLSALGQTDTTDAEGNFTLRGNVASVPARTLVEVTIPAMTMAREFRTERFEVNTTGQEFPLEIFVTRQSDGSYLVTVASEDSTSDDVVAGDTTETGEDILEEETEEESSDEDTATAPAGCRADSECPADQFCLIDPATNAEVGTCVVGTRSECDPSQGAIEFNPACPADRPFCPDGFCVECIEDASCGPAARCELNICQQIGGCDSNDECLDDEVCEDSVCVPRTCEESDMICSGGGAPLCVSSCRCDDGFPIGDCTAVCFDTGSTPTECDAAGIGCPSGESMVCPN